MRLSAAFLNAAGANVDDFCDTHTATVIHPTAPVAACVVCLRGIAAGSAVPTCCWLLSSATRSRPASGSRSRPATTTGDGTSPRPAACSAPLPAIGKLAPLDERQMVWALGIAATQSAGLCECLGTPAKASASATPPQRSVVGPAGREGIRRSAEPLAGVQGFYHALAETAGPVPHHRRLGRALGDHGDVLQAVPVRLCDSSRARLRAGLASRSSGQPKSRVSWCAEIPCSASAPTGRCFDRPRSAGQRAACGRRGAGEGQGRVSTSLPMPACRIPKYWRCGARSKSCATRAFPPSRRRSRSRPRTVRFIKLEQTAARGSDANPTFRCAISKTSCAPQRRMESAL